MLLIWIKNKNKQQKQTNKTDCFFQTWCLIISALGVVSPPPYYYAELCSFVVLQTCFEMSCKLCFVVFVWFGRVCVCVRARARSLACVCARAFVPVVLLVLLCSGGLLFLLAVAVVACLEKKKRQAKGKETGPSLTKGAEVQAIPSVSWFLSSDPKWRWRIHGGENDGGGDVHDPPQLLHPLPHQRTAGHADPAWRGPTPPRLRLLLHGRPYISYVYTLTRFWAV